MSSKNARYTRIASLRSNGEYFFIGDKVKHIYHRKSSSCVEQISKKSMVGLGRNPGENGFRPCLYCSPEKIVLPEPQQDLQKASSKEPQKGSREQKSKAELMREELVKTAYSYGLHLEFFGSNVYVTTIAGEWYFDYNIRPIALHHKNNRLFLTKGGKPKKYYHEQDKTFSTPLEVITYIFRHEKAAVQRGFLENGSNAGPVLLTLNEAVAAAEKQAIITALKASSNKKAAAEILGVDVKTLYRKRKQYGIK